jgi:hydrogenase maturation protein HypF
MPGGEAAILRPYRLAAGYTYAFTGQTPPFEIGATQEELRIIRQQVRQGINCPLTSAGGRLFDAVSALLGIRSRVSFEAQAAMELEAVAVTGAQTRQGPGGPYPYVIETGSSASSALGVGIWQIRLGGMLDALMADRQAGLDVGWIAYRFHVTVTDMIWAACRRIAEEAGLDTVALSGGCFQNRLLLALVTDRLRQAGLHALIHREVPCNDGGVALGQAAIAQWAA